MSRLDAKLALMAIDTVSDYPKNWMYLLPNENISNFQCLGCLDLCPCDGERYQEKLEAHSLECTSNTELAISRFELLSVLGQIAKMEYQTTLNSLILSQILSRGGVILIMAKELGCLIPEDNRYFWEADFNKVINTLDIDKENIIDNDGNEISEWLERINKKENNG